MTWLPKSAPRLRSHGFYNPFVFKLRRRPPRRSHSRPADLRAIVDGEAGAYETKHVKPNPQANIEGGRIRRLRPVHISKLALLDPKTNKAATRVKHERTDKGVTVRVAKKSGHRFESK